MTAVTWTMTLAEPPPDGAPIAVQQMVLPGWASISLNAEMVAHALAEEFFRGDMDGWRRHFGDDDDATVVVDIHLPVAVAGRYTVVLERTVKAHARRMARPLQLNQRGA